MGAAGQVDAKEVTCQDRLGRGLRNCDQVDRARRGARSMPLVLRICHAVDAATLTPRRPSQQARPNGVSRHRTNAAPCAVIKPARSADRLAAEAVNGQVAKVVFAPGPSD